jgi:hypothetical protein
MFQSERPATQPRLAQARCHQIPFLLGNAMQQQLQTWGFLGIQFQHLCQLRRPDHASVAVIHAPAAAVLEAFGVNQQLVQRV